MMLFLSKLLVNIGEAPTRYRPAREWLRNRYRVHQRLWMAFSDGPEPAGKSDPDYPYFPDRLPQTNSPETHFLFRIETDRSPVILVQSTAPPVWQRAFWNAEYLLDRDHPWLVNEEYERAIEHIDQGDRLRFRLLANPTRKVATIPRKRREVADQERRHGRRVPVPGDEASLHDWLERRAEPRWSPARNSEDKQLPPGFRLVEIIGIQTGYVYFNKTRDAAKGQRLRSARYEGILEVTNPDDFRKTLIRGIGPAKAFGFGLLSVSPAAEG